MMCDVIDEKSGKGGRFALLVKRRGKRCYSPLLQTPPTSHPFSGTYDAQVVTIKSITIDIKINNMMEFWVDWWHLSPS